MTTTKTGAELRAWRERLGKDEAWAATLLDAVPLVTHGMCGNGYGDARRGTTTRGR